MSLVFILAGVPGSGKSTLLAEVVKRIPELKIINYGDMMLQEAALHNIDKDSLRKLPLQKQQKFGIDAARKMAGNMAKLTCIDTHAMVKTPMGYCPGLPEEIIRILKPNAIGMVESPASMIYERRKQDGSRKRDSETIEQIDYHQQISRSFLLACSAFSNTLFVPIHNHGSPLDGAQQLVALIESR